MKNIESKDMPEDKESCENPVEKTNENPAPVNQDKPGVDIVRILNIPFSDILSINIENNVLQLRTKSGTFFGKSSLKPLTPEQEKSIIANVKGIASMIAAQSQDNISEDTEKSDGDPIPKRDKHPAETDIEDGCLCQDCSGAPNCKCQKCVFHGDCFYEFAKDQANSGNDDNPCLTCDTEENDCNGCPNSFDNDDDDDDYTALTSEPIIPAPEANTYITMGNIKIKNINIINGADIGEVMNAILKNT